jgi:hypothetical protein
VRHVQLISALLAAVLIGAAGLADAAAAPATHTLTVNIGGTGSGVIRGDSVNCSASDGQPSGPCTVTELTGSVVTLTASADKGSVFSGWSGDGCSGAGSCKVALTSDVTVTATFYLSTVSAKARSLPVSRSGRTTSLPMTCKGPGSCIGSVQLSANSNGKTVTLASSPYNIASGRTANVKLRFSAGTVAKITNHKGRFRATLTITPIDGQSLNSRVTLKPV